MDIIFNVYIVVLNILLYTYIKMLERSNRMREKYDGRFTKEVAYGLLLGSILWPVIVLALIYAAIVY